MAVIGSYEKQNILLAKELAELRLLNQSKERTIFEIKAENLHLREYLFKVEKSADQQKKTIDNLEIAKLEASMENEDYMHDILDMSNPIVASLVNFLNKKLAPFDSLAKKVDESLKLQYSLAASQCSSNMSSGTSSISSSSSSNSNDSCTTESQSTSKDNVTISQIRQIQPYFEINIVKSNQLFNKIGKLSDILEDEDEDENEEEDEKVNNLEKNLSHDLEEFNESKYVIDETILDSSIINKCDHIKHTQEIVKKNPEKMETLRVEIEAPVQIIEIKQKPKSIEESKYSKQSRRQSQAFIFSNEDQEFIRSLSQRGTLENVLS